MSLKLKLKMKTQNKFKSLELISKISTKLKNKNKKIVLCHGVFDLLHVGHIKHFEEAKKHGDILIVSITKDQFIKKGINRPYFKIDDRITSLCALESVNYVIESPQKNSIEVLKKIKPNFYCKGKDYKDLSSDKTKEIKKEKKTVEVYGGKLIFTKTQLNSSSKLLFENDLIYTSDQKKYLLKISKNINIKKIELILKKIQKLKVLVIGETIIDKYTFCETIGKASKEPILVLKENYEKIFIGGAASIAQNMRNLVDKVDFFSEIGTKNSYKRLLNSRLKNIKKFIFQTRNKATIEKKRFVDEVSNSKILGVYNIDDKEENYPSQNKKNNFLKKNVNKYDLVVLSDYGHGLLDKNISKTIIRKSKFLFVNCQINANNRGSHSIIKYKGSHNLIINESELRYEMRDNKTQITNLVKRFSNLYDISNVVVTQGSEGTLFYSKKENNILNVPAIANKIVDKVGTGDMMLATISLFFAVSKDHNIGLVAGSMFGAKTIEKYGNENILNSAELLKFFSSFIK